MGSAAFLAPLMRTVPRSGPLPRGYGWRPCLESLPEIGEMAKQLAHGRRAGRRATSSPGVLL